MFSRHSFTFTCFLKSLFVTFWAGGVGNEDCDNSPETTQQSSKSRSSHLLFDVLFTFRRWEEVLSFLGL